jgi:hypothetical protein
MRAWERFTVLAFFALRYLWQLIRTTPRRYWQLMDSLHPAFSCGDGRLTDGLLEGSIVRTARVLALQGTVGLATPNI